MQRKSNLTRASFNGLLITACLASCVGQIGDSAGVGGNGTSPLGSQGSQQNLLSDGGATASLLPVRVRRLSNQEFDATTAALLGTKQIFATTFNADQRQGSYNAGGFPAAGFTRNAGAIFDSVSAPQVQMAADSLATEAASRLSTLAPCASGADQTTCATTFIKTFGNQAYRRPITSDEVTGLLAVYQAGLKDQTYAAGIQLVVTTILQSAGFLYLTELGGTPTNGVAELTSYEVANELSYFLTGGPPDATLLQAAAADKLQDPADVGQQATRLLATAGAKQQLAVFVEQWLGIDSPPGTTTGVAVTGAEMTQETTAVIDDVMFNGDGTLKSLLTAPYTFVDGPLAQLYGMSATANGMTKVPTNNGRVGLLNQASFLNTYAHSTFSAPVKRGHMVRTQMLCAPIPPPDPKLMVNMTPPVPAANQTTRQADEEHKTNPACAACHDMMDPIGYGFEGFDGTGAYRSTQNGQPIDQSAQVQSGGDATGMFTDGAAMIAHLAQSTVIEQCYWSHFIDYAAGTTDTKIEATFLNFWQGLPDGARESLPKVILALVQSDLFLKRSVQ